MDRHLTFGNIVMCHSGYSIIVDLEDLNFKFTKYSFSELYISSVTKSHFSPTP